jgi:polyvinyl alcohol dehydrogenase (cytochrome)
VLEVLKVLGVLGVLGVLAGARAGGSFVNRWVSRVLVAAVGVVATAGVASAQLTQGIALFEQTCGACHEHPSNGSRAPDRASLSQRTPEAILDAITTGTMKDNAARLTDAQKRILAEQLTGKPLGVSQLGQASSMKNRCEARPFPDVSASPMWSGWGVDTTNARYQTATTLTQDRVPKLALKWAFAFPNGSSAFGQPAVAGGRVFVGSDNGFVYSLDAATGCVYWSFQAQAGVRTAISVGPRLVYFGDLKGNVYAVEAATGALAWTKRADPHPFARITGAPALVDGKLYVPVASLEEGAGANPNYECCTFRGALVVYDALNGNQVWKTFTIPEEPKPIKKNSIGTTLWGPAGAAIWSSPTVDTKRGVVYVGTGNSYTFPASANTDSVMAFDLRTGAMLWSHEVLADDAYVVGCNANTTARDNCPSTAGPDFDFGTSPILRTLPDGRSVLVIGQKAGIAWALDPDKKGAVLWQEKVGRGSALGGIEWGLAADDSLAYLPVADAQYGPDQAGGLFALSLTDGTQKWMSRPSQAANCTGTRACVAARSAALSVVPGVVFSGTTDGMMRAYSTADGRVLWEFNTVREYDTVNGVAGKGGSINGPGPVIAGDMLFTNSGYAYLGTGMPGNVLLAFGVE